MLFLANTGLRWGEMAALRVMDLDMLRRRVNVAQAVTEVGRDLVYGTPKNHSRRSVPFPPFLGEMLAAHCEGKQPSDFVFTAPDGGALHNKNWRARKFEPAMRQMLELHPDLVRLVPHDLHTAASLVISAGANVKAVQKCSGTPPQPRRSTSMPTSSTMTWMPRETLSVPLAIQRLWANGGWSPTRVTNIRQK